MKRESRAPHPAPAASSPLAKPATFDALVVYLTEYGDWRHLDAYARGGDIWSLHIEHCEECRKVQEQWDAANQRGAA